LQLAQTLVFERVRLAKTLVHFVRERLPHYGPLLSEDLHRFRDEIVKATVGAGLSMAAGLIFCCFLSVAVIVSAWDGSHRVLIAWLVCAAWCVLALAGVLAARRALVAPRPFSLVGQVLLRDYALLIDVVEMKDPERPH
jgi:hypothetical protein